MNDWEKWRERVRDICAGGTWWWWWWWWWCILPVNSNGYVPFLINTLDIILRMDIFPYEVVTTSCGHLLHTAGEYCILLMTELYNSSTSTFFLWASQIALIQPVHGQGYILIFLDRMHLLFTRVHFLFDSPAGSEVNIQHHHRVLWQLAKSKLFWPCTLKVSWKPSSEHIIMVSLRNVNWLNLTLNHLSHARMIYKRNKFVLWE